MPILARRRTVWVVPLLLCLAILLVAGLAFNLAHLDTGGEQIPSANSGSPSANYWGLLDSATAQELLAVAFFAFLVGSVVYILTRPRGMRVKRILQPASWSELVAAFIFLLVFVGLIYLWPRLAQRAAPTSPGSNNTAGAAANTTVIPVVSGVPIGIFLAGALFVSVVLVALFLHAGNALRRPPPTTPLRARRLAAAEALGATLAELQLGVDVRTAVLACYQRFCSLLDMRGIQAQEALTPGELQELAIRRLEVSSDAAAVLTGLFEEARYSEHTLGEPDRDRAVQSLERLRSDMEA